MFRRAKHNGIFYQLGQDISLPSKRRLAKKEQNKINDKDKGRLLAAMTAFFLAFCVLNLRLFDVIILNGNINQTRHEKSRKTYALDLKMNRSEIIDRNGVPLAISLPSVNLTINPKKVKNPKVIAAALSQTLPDLDYKSLLKDLERKNKSFIYVKRNLTPNEQYEVNRLGFHQLEFENTETRVYPQGSLVSHIIGKSNIDDIGISGVEKAFNKDLANKNMPLQLSIDVGIQDSVRLSLTESMKKYDADGASAVLMKAKTGEIVSIVSLPDYNPNNINQADKNNLFNTASLGVYEVGSIMKLFSIAMGLDTKTITLKDKVDASKPLVFANYKINDIKKIRRELSISEILIHSSNIGAAKVGLAVGAEKQKEYFKRFGFFKSTEVELPERGQPLMPSKWREINTATASYGYGIALTPVHIVASVAALVNGGIYNPPTLLAKRYGKETISHRVITKETSDKMKALMRLVVIKGSGKNANVQGYEVGGKTGSAQKLVNGKYIKGKLRTSFVSAFPMDNPQYVLMVMLDNPKGIKETYNFNTSAWNAVPTAEKIISSVAPQLGIMPRPYETKQQAPYVDAFLNAD